VSVAFALRGEIQWRDAGYYVAAQIIGAILGVWAAHLMFELPLWQVSLHSRTGNGWRSSSRPLVYHSKDVDHAITSTALGMTLRD
jgi:glycerol uptake facilitator-like aquaporin